MADIYGFVSEPHKNGRYLVSPATRTPDGEVTCHDPSGFLGSWPMHEGGVFFECISDDVFDPMASARANAHAQDANQRNKTGG